MILSARAGAPWPELLMPHFGHSTACGLSLQKDDLIVLERNEPWHVQTSLMSDILMFIFESYAMWLGVNNSF